MLRIGCFVITLLMGGLFIVAVTWPRSGDSGTDKVAPPSTSASQPVGSVKPVDPHEERLKELHKKRDGLDITIQIETAFARQLAHEAIDLSHDPVADPNESQYVMNKMEEQKTKIADLVAQRHAIDAEIAREEGGQSMPEGSVNAASGTPLQPTQANPPTISIDDARTVLQKAHDFCVSSNSKTGDLTRCVDVCAPETLQLFNNYGLTSVEEACRILKAAQ
jgi:hypothetical protein